MKNEKNSLNLFEIQKSINIINRTYKELKATQIAELINKKPEEIINQIDVTSAFRNEYCFYFADILKEIYKEYDAKFYTNCMGGHALVKIGNVLYDTEGYYTNEDIEDFKETEGDYWISFIDSCNIGKSHERIKDEETFFEGVKKQVLSKLKNDEVKKL